MPDTSTTGGSASKPAPLRAYHHGALADALRRAVVDLVAESGVGAVTMAECARRAGVTGAAPYRHFGSLDELLLATARSCYDDWNARRARRGRGPVPPEQAMREVTDDFFALARDDPGAFTLIFDSSLRRRSRLVEEWARDDYQKFLRLVSAMSGAPVAECDMPALGILAIVLGHVKLSQDGFSGISLEHAAELSFAAIVALLDGFKLARSRTDRSTEQARRDGFQPSRGTETDSRGTETESKETRVSHAIANRSHPHGGPEGHIDRAETA